MDSSRVNRAVAFPAENLLRNVRAQRDEIESAIWLSVRDIADPADTAETSYLSGLRSAITAAVDYGLGAIGSPPPSPPEPVPVNLLTQARRAARNAVGLEVILRRYTAGYRLLTDRIIAEAASAEIGLHDLRAALSALSHRLDCVVAAVSEEYGREAEEQARTGHERRSVILHRLIRGETLDTSELDYDFEGYHLAIVASGQELEESLDVLLRKIDRRRLVASPDSHSTWAWLGGRIPFDREELRLIAEFDWPTAASLACGEAGKGWAGWRLSHRQGSAALLMTERSTKVCVWYQDVALLASVFQDDLLASSLRQAYIAPLEEDRDRGTAAKS